MTMNTSEIKSFFSHSEESLRDTLKDGYYRLKVTEAVVGLWYDGRAKLDIKTEVVEGEKAGSFGPNHTWSLGDFEGTTKDGREFKITAKENRRKMIKQVYFTVHEGKDLLLSAPTVFDEQMLKEIARQIKGDEFIGMVKENADGYMRLTRIFSISNPPNKFKTLIASGGFEI